MKNIFIIQKRAIRILLRLSPRSCCREGINKVPLYSWRAVTGVVFTATKTKFGALFRAVSRWFMFVLLVVSITSLSYLSIGLTEVL